MAEGDGAAVRVDALVLEVDVHELQAAEHLARERLVDLDDLHVAELQVRALQRQRNRVSGPYAHDARLDAGARGRQDFRDRLLAVFLAPLFAADQQRRRAVVHAGSIAGRHHAAFEQGLQFLERFDRGVTSRVLIRLEYFGRRIFLFRGQVDGQNLALVETFLLRGGVFLLGGEGEFVRLLARDAEFLRDVVAGLGHRVVAVELDRFRVREAHADGRVVHLGIAAERAVWLADHVGRARHALHAARDVEVALAAGNGARGVDDGLQPARAKTVHRHAGRGGRQAGKQGGEARDVAVVLARLIHAAEDHVGNLLWVHLVARYDLLDHLRGEVVGAHRRKLAGVPADGGAQSVVDVGIEHWRYSGVSSETPSFARRLSQGLGR